MRRLYGVLREKVLKQRKASYIGAIVGCTTTAVFTLGYVLAIAAGARLYGEGLLTIGAVYLIIHYTELLNRPLSQITNQIEDLQRATASIGRIDELLNTHTALPDTGTMALPPGPLAVDLDDVTFAYEEQPVLRSVTFHLAAGRTLGLLGRTGSGKTTITRLLFRFYDVTGGSVRLAGRNVRDARLAELRERVAVVTQDVQLFHASVRDNLTFFDRSVSDHRIMEAIDALGLSAWLASLPDGLDTELSGGGAGLSAGEAQLIAFTRVFLGDPGLIILDEASSRLDPATERLIENAVHRLLAGRTAVVVAHRLATVQRVDDILVLEDGQVVEHGPRTTLAADPGSRFAALLRTGIESVDLTAATQEAVAAR
jgi:ABC-type multidrug transport system fused ATPase/permease subunit